MPQERSIVAAMPEAIQQKWLVRSASRCCRGRRNVLARERAGQQSCCNGGLMREVGERAFDLAAA